MAVERVCGIAGLVSAEPKSNPNVNASVLLFILFIVALSGSNGCP